MPGSNEYILSYHGSKQPSVYVVYVCCRHLRDLYQGHKFVYLKIGVGVAALAGLGFLLYKYIRRK